MRRKEEPFIWPKSNGEGRRERKAGTKVEKKETAERIANNCLTNPLYNQSQKPRSKLRASNLQHCRAVGYLVYALLRSALNMCSWHIAPLAAFYTPFRSVRNVCHRHTASPNGHASMSAWLVARGNKGGIVMGKQKKNSDDGVIGCLMNILRWRSHLIS